MAFDITSQFRSDLPVASGPWGGYPPYSFVGGHNDADNVPVGGLAEAASVVLNRYGRDLAAYNLGGGPQGHEPLREFVAQALAGRAGMSDSAENVLITSGSLQALDLINELLINPGDVVIVEQATYGGMVSRLQRAGAEVVGVELDDDGIRPDHLAELLDRLAAEGRRVAYLYTIPTVQNPTGSVLPTERRRRVLDVARAHDLVVFEDECYSDLLWDGPRPPAVRALDTDGRVIYCGSFSKSIAPALRVGYIVADWPVLAQLLALKTDAGSGALEQLVLAEYATTHFDDHVSTLSSVLQGKAESMMTAVDEAFGGSAVYAPPRGGIFLWLTFDESVNTTALAAPALEAGIEFNPGAGWSADPEWGQSRLRLCFGHPDEETIRDGVHALADVFRQQGAI